MIHGHGRAQLDRTRSVAEEGAARTGVCLEEHARPAKLVLKRKRVAEVYSIKRAHFDKEAIALANKELLIEGEILEKL